MAPKKAAAAPAVEKGSKVASAGETKAKPTVVKMKTLGHPPTLSMVVEVLKKNSERKGTSVQAIRSRILAAHPTVDPVRLKFLLRSALNKGIEKGILIRPPNSSATGATGRFKLAKPGPKPKEGSDSKMSENVDPNVQPKTGKTKEGSKKVVKKNSKKPKAGKEDSKADENPEVTATEKDKTPEPKAAASKPKKEAAEKTDKGAAEKTDTAPAKKPKSKMPSEEEGAKSKKEPAKKKVEESKAKDSEEKPAAKSSKKGKK